MLYEAKDNSLKISADTFGAELHSVQLDGKEYLWQCGDAWKRYAPILFPFVCSPKDRTYFAKGNKYKMLANHGFARDSEFAFSAQTENSVEFVLMDNDVTYSQYPYHFMLKVKYTVEGNTVKVRNTVKNLDEEKMYFYIGAHPAFNCPLEEGEDFDDYYIEYETKEHITQKIGDETKVLLNYGQKIEVSRELFDNDAIVLDMPNSKKISLKSKKSQHSVTVKYPMSDCIAVWSPTGDNDARFVCLEPWSSVPVYEDDIFESIENKPHAVSLNPDEEYIYAYDIELN